MLKSTFATRLKAARLAAGKSQKALADAVGLKQPSIANMESGDIASSSVTAEMAAFLGVRALWLATGKGPRLVGEVATGPDLAEPVPLISWVQAGNWNPAEHLLTASEIEHVYTHVTHSDGTYALRVHGDSMTSPFGRSYPDGCIIIVDPERRSPVNGQRIIAKLVGEDEVTFKSFVQEGKRTWLKPLNPQYPPIYDEFRVLGTIIAKQEDE